MGITKRPEKDSINDGKDCGISANAECQCQDRRGGETGGACHGTCGVAKVLTGLTQPQKRAFMAVRLSGVLDLTACEARPEACFCGSKAVSQMLLIGKAIDLAVQIAICLFCGEEILQRREDAREVPVHARVPSTR